MVAQKNESHSSMKAA